jgi:hypothetical protein
VREDLFLYFDFSKPCVPIERFFVLPVRRGLGIVFFFLLLLLAPSPTMQNFIAHLSHLFDNPLASAAFSTSRPAFSMMLSIASISGDLSSRELKRSLKLLSRPEGDRAALVARNPTVARDVVQQFRKRCILRTSQAR